MVLGLFKRYHRQRVLISPKEYMTEMRSNQHGRMDMDGLVQYTGEDEEGNLKLPTDQELKLLFEKRGKIEKWSGRNSPCGGTTIWNDAPCIQNLRGDSEDHGLPHKCGIHP